MTHIGELVHSSRSLLSAGMKIGGLSMITYFLTDLLVKVPSPPTGKAVATTCALIAGNAVANEIREVYIDRNINKVLASSYFPVAAVNLGYSMVSGEPTPIDAVLGPQTCATAVCFASLRAGIMNGTGDSSQTALAAAGVFSYGMAAAGYSAISGRPFNECLLDANYLATALMGSGALWFLKESASLAIEKISVKFHRRYNQFFENAGV